MNRRQYVGTASVHFGKKQATAWKIQYFPDGFYGFIIDETSIIQSLFLLCACGRPTFSTVWGVAKWFLLHLLFFLFD